MRAEPLGNAVDLLKALAHPVRLRILSLLRKGELCVCQITEIIGLAFSTISEHLSELRRAGVALERKQGRWVYYALHEEPHVRGLLNALWPAVERDATLLRDRREAGLVRKIPLPVICKSLASSSASRARSSSRHKAKPRTDVPKATKSQKIFNPSREV